MIDLVAAIKEDPDIDPLLQVALLRRVVDLAGQGSEPLRESLKDGLAMLEQADVDVTVPWMDPENQDAIRLRPRASQLIRDFPDLANVRKQTKSRAELIERKAATLAVTIG